MEVRIGYRDFFSSLGDEGGRAEGLLVLALVVAEEEERVVGEEEDVVGALRLSGGELGLEPGVLLVVVFLSLEIVRSAEASSLIYFMQFFFPVPSFFLSFCYSRQGKAQINKI